MQANIQNIQENHAKHQSSKNSNENIYDDVNEIYEFDKSELEFTLMDVMSSMTIFKPFSAIFSKSGMLKNHDNYMKLAKLLSNDDLDQNKYL